jgi:chromate reductase
MADEVTILPILGSLRVGSFNRQALQAARELAPRGVTMLDTPDLKPIPPFDMDDLDALGVPAHVGALGDAIRAADAVLFVSPEYNYSIPGVLKNAIDWVSRLPEQPFKGKPVGVMGVSPGPVGTARMQYHLRQVFVFLEALPVGRPEVMIGNARERFVDGRLSDEQTREFVAGYLVMLRDWTLRLRSPDLLRPPNS